MKKILSASAMIVLIWGCAKKIAPTETGAAPAANTQTATPPDGKGRDVSTDTGLSTAGNTDTNKPAATATDAAVAAGQSTYNAKCGRCHGLKNPGDFTAERWVGIMDAMAPKAHLTDMEKANVYAYVKANAKK